MINKCPGQVTNRNLDSVVVPCPECGRLIEFFSDEMERSCRCGKVLLRESLPQCGDWCPAAADCAGEAIDVREMQRLLEKVKNDPRAKACLASIEEKLHVSGEGEDRA